MAVYTSIKDMSTTASSNAPDGDVETVDGGDDHFRSLYALFRASLSAGSDLTAAATVTIPANAGTSKLSGTTTVTGFASTNSWAGRVHGILHNATHQFTHSSTLKCPGGGNKTFVSGDWSWWRDEDGAGTWRCVGSLAATTQFAGIKVINTAGQNAISITDGTAGFDIFTNGASGWILNGSLNTAGAINTNNTARMTFAAAGNVAVNAPTSGTTLALTNVSGAAALTTTDGTCTAGLSSFGASGALFGVTSNHSLAFLTNNATVMTLSAAGDVTFAGGVFPANASITTRTLALSDGGKSLIHDSISTHTLTIPPNASVAFPLGTVIRLASVDGGAGFTLARGSGVVLIGPSGADANRTIGTNGVATLMKVATNTWNVDGSNIS